MPGCGTFSLYNVSSFILFPNFALRINDSANNIVSYKSIGRSATFKLNYAQPRANRASSTTLAPHTTQPNLIGPDKDETIPTIPLAYHIPTLKSMTTTSTPPPATPILPPPPPSPPHDLDLEEDPPDTPTQQELSKKDLLANTSTPLSTTMLNKLHSNPTDLPDIRPCNTAAPCENHATFGSVTNNTLPIHQPTPNLSLQASCQSTLDCLLP